jgi:hypothetical protein
MFNHRSRPPSLRRHKPSGQAVVTLGGKDHYLGPWPAGKRKPPPAAQEAYDRLIAEWLANGRRLPQRAEECPVTVADLIVAYFRHVEQHYRPRALRGQGPPRGGQRPHAATAEARDGAVINPQ